MRGFREIVVAGILLAAGVGPAAALVVVRRAQPDRPARRVVVVGRPVTMGAPVVIAGRPHGAVDLDVSPEATLVWVDGKLRGTCDDFDGVPAKLYLLPGIHTLKLKTPEGEEHTGRIRVVAGREINVNLAMPE
jgi:hypothetical protein